MPMNSIAELASQLQAFISTKHPFASDLDPAILQSIEFYAPPPTSSLQRQLPKKEAPVRSLDPLNHPLTQLSGQTLDPSSGQQCGTSKSS